MPKKSKSITFQNATIDLKSRLISEEKKDQIVETDLDEFLAEWDGVSGVSISVKQDVTIGAGD